MKSNTSRPLSIHSIKVISDLGIETAAITIKNEFLVVLLISKEKLGKTKKTLFLLIQRNLKKPNTLRNDNFNLNEAEQ